tara:strand:+ start:206 stop:922 length:717 start_codon:yes stop_codon:yes gene_type:complete
VRSNIVDTYENKGSNSLFYFITAIYFILILGYQIKSNLISTKELCGSEQWGVVLLWSIVPNIIILGSLVAILKFFPGWKAPFANTFGYAITQLAGLKKLLNKILKDGKGQDQETSKIIRQVYTDPTDIINEITPNTWDDLFAKESFKGLFKPKLFGLFHNGAADELKELYKFVALRDMTSEFIWYMLAGGFINSIQTSGLAKLKCINPSNKNNEENERWQAKQNTENNKPNKRYFIDE